MKVRDDEVKDEFNRLMATKGSRPVILNQGFKKGMVLAWSGSIDQIPNGWSLCDGTNYTGGSDKKPDLRGRFILGHSAGRTIGTKGGEENVTLSVDQMPSHKHFVSRSGETTDTDYFWKSEQTTSNTGAQLKSIAAYRNKQNTEHNYAFAGRTSEADHGESSYTGDGQSHNNMPPYYVLAYIVKETDDFQQQGEITPYRNISEDGNTVSIGQKGSGAQLCIGETCINESHLKKIVNTNQEMVHERVLYGWNSGVNGGNEFKFGHNWEQITQYAYGITHTQYGMPTMKPGVKERKHRLYAVFNDDIAKQGVVEVEIRVRETKTTDPKNIKFALGRTWGAPSSNWSRDAYSEFKPTSAFGSGDHSTIWIRCTGKNSANGNPKGVLKWLTLQTWDFY
jgi:microcystin-dependent protein